MLRPNFEDPLDTAQDLVDNNITLYFTPGGNIWKQFLSLSPITAYNKLSETVYITTGYDEFDYYSKHNVIGNGTHAYMGSFLPRYILAMGTWYRSKQNIVGKYPYGGYLSNKKWYLNKVGKFY